MTVTIKRADRIILHNISWQQFASPLLLVTQNRYDYDIFIKVSEGGY